MPRKNETTVSIPAGDGFVGEEGNDFVLTGSSVLAGFEELSGLDEAPEYLNAILFGQEATGKTTAAVHAVKLPGDGKVVVVNAESGLKPTALRRFGLDTSQVILYPPAGEKITYAGLEDLYDRLRGALKQQPGAVKAVVFDSLTEITNILLEQITEYAYERAKENARLAARDTKHTTMVQDYGQMTTEVRTLVRRFRDLPCHFVATALEKEMDEDGVKQTAPEMSPKLATSVLGYVDVAIRFEAETLETGEDTYATLIEGQCQKSHRVRAKDRFGVLPHIMAEPTIDRVWAVIQGDWETAGNATELYREHREAAEAYKAEKRAARMNRGKR